MRYKPTLHPEHQLVWGPEGIQEGRSWADVIAQKTHLEDIDPNIQHYFKALAFRMGQQMRRFIYRGRSNYHDRAMLPVKHLDRALDAWETAFVRLANENDVPTVMDVVSQSEPSKHQAGMRYSTAIQHIRNGIINELVANKTMLFPSRATRYIANDGTQRLTLLRPPLWQWALPTVRGKQKRFFSVDRWPLNLQSEKTQERIRSDADLDPNQLWNPCDEDPCLPKWYRPKAKPYVDEKVKYRWGPQTFPVGDTPLQRTMVQDAFTTLVGEGKSPHYDVISLLGDMDCTNAEFSYSLRHRA